MSRGVTSGTCGETAGASEKVSGFTAPRLHHQAGRPFCEGALVSVRVSEVETAQRIIYG